MNLKQFAHSCEFPKNEQNIPAEEFKNLILNPIDHRHSN